MASVRGRWEGLSSVHAKGRNGGEGTLRAFNPGRSRSKFRIWGGVV
jgi:hypothetical protein